MASKPAAEMMDLTQSPIDLTHSDDEAQPATACDEDGAGSQEDLQTKKAHEKDEAESAAEVAAAAEAERQAAAAAEAERKAAAAAEAERKAAAAETESDSDEGAGGSQADLESSQAQPRPPPGLPPAHFVAQHQAVYNMDPVVSQQKQPICLDGHRIVMSGSHGSCPAIASTSPQAVASFARMRVVPSCHSASSEKPAKELGKGKQKAPDRMEGSAKKPKTSCHFEHKCNQVSQKVSRRDRGQQKLDRSSEAMV